jgi:hypothetical protein
VVRFAGAAPIDPFAITQLVTLPRLADGNARKQREQGDDEGKRFH